MVLNPWEVHSIDDFNYFCCPECVFRSKEDISFQAHALQNHELSKTFFNNVEQGYLLRGHSTTTLANSYHILTTYPSRVDNFGHF